MSLALSLLVSFCPLFRLRVDSHIELEFIDALAHIICLLRSIPLFDSRLVFTDSMTPTPRARLPFAIAITIGGGGFAYSIVLDPHSLPPFFVRGLSKHSQGTDPTP